MKGVPLRLAAMASDRSFMFDPRSDVAGYAISTGVVLSLAF